MSHASRVSQLEPQALHELLKHNDLMLVQVTSAQVYQQAHIAGAILVEPGQLVCGIAPATGRLPSHEALSELFSNIGYHPDKELVVYDDEGGGWAGRLAWTLDVIGHRHWQYLNGGLQAWHHAGLELVSGAPAPIEATQNLALNIDTAPIAEIPDVLAAIDDDHQIVWDVRSVEEYQGIKQASARSGHIPGAINLDWMQLKDPQQQMRISANVQQQLADLGLTDKAIITHCQTHHRSGLSYMLGRLLGLDIRAYHGSWSEWGNRDDTPIET